MSVKYVCDLCGADADGEKFVVPAINKYYATGKGGAKLVAFSKLEPCEMHLCVKCQTYISGFINACEQFGFMKNSSG